MTLFDGWDRGVVENGGYGVSWATLMGLLVKIVENRLPPRISRPPRPMFLLVYVAVNALGAAIGGLRGGSLETNLLSPRA